MNQPVNPNSHPQWMEHMWSEDTFTWLDSLDDPYFHEVMFMSMTEFADRELSNFSPRMFLPEEAIIRILKSRNPDLEDTPTPEGVDDDPLFDLLIEAQKATPLLYKLPGLLLGVDFTPERADDFMGAFVLPHLYPRPQKGFWGSESNVLSSLLNHPQVPAQVIERTAILFLITYDLTASSRKSPYRSSSNRMWLSMLDRNLPEESLARLADHLIKSLESKRQELAKSIGMESATRELDGSAWLELLASLTQRNDFPESWVQKHQEDGAGLPILHRSLPQTEFEETFPVTYAGFLSLTKDPTQESDGEVDADIPLKWLKPEEVSDEEAFELGRRAVLQIPGGESEVHYAGWYIHCLREQMGAHDIPLEWLLLAETE